MLDTKGKHCPGHWLRVCELHGQCTLTNEESGHHTCTTCPDHKDR
jgi:hypothetical protein